MNISPISYRTPNFQSNKRSIFDDQGKLLYKTTTYMFRDDFDWNPFLELIKSKYANTPKVNFVIEGCSNGAECYSAAMKILTELANESKKFFPIIARDIDSCNIENAKQGAQIGITDYDLYRINYHTKGRINEFMEYKQTSNPSYFAALAPKQALQEQIQFSKGDIMQDIYNIPNKNTILLCRNFWQYLNEENKNKIARVLSERLDHSSLVGIGAFDSGAQEALEANGFLQTGVENIYTKPSCPNYRRF